MPRGFDERTWLEEIKVMTLPELRRQITRWRLRAELVGTAQLRKGHERRIREVEAQIRERFPIG
jgi:hypothetical protein